MQGSGVRGLGIGGFRERGFGIQRLDVRVLTLGMRA